MRKLLLLLILGVIYSIAAPSAHAQQPGQGCTTVGQSVPYVGGGSLICIQTNDGTLHWSLGGGLSTGFITPPTNCTAGNVPTGVDAQGNALNCNGVVQTSVTNNFTAVQNFKADIGCFHGPNPYVDIRCYGARAGNPNAAPFAAGITATCNGTTSLTLSAASTFVNGDGIVVYNCGAAQSMTTPSAPTVTPSVAANSPGTGVTVAGPTGATTYNYKLVAMDKNGGYTIASATGSTSTGAASLGAQSAATSSSTRSNTVMSFTTSSAHGMVAGAMVDIASCVDTTFDGRYLVTTAADNTHITVIANLFDTRNGATTSTTGCVLNYYNLNHITFSAVTGAWKFIAYSDRANPGTFVPVCQSNPQGAQNTDLTCDDFGSPMNDNQLFPPSSPASPPVSAGNDNLSTTISSGAGTTTLTLAASAGASITAGARIDACPGLLAAATASATLTGNLTIPVDPNGNSFVINSYCLLNNRVAVSQMGSLYLNETLEYTPVSLSNGGKWYGEMMPQYGSGVGPGSFQSNVAIAVNTARPGMYWGGEFGNSISGVTFNCVVTNGCLAMMEEGGFNQSHDRMNFFSQGGANDYLTILLYERGKGGVQSATGVSLDKVQFSPGASTGAPAWFCNDCGVAYLRSVYQVHRGNVYIEDNSGGSLKIGDLSYINGGGTPLYTLSGGTAFGITSTGSIIMDTIAEPCFVALTSTASQITNNGATCNPASGVPGLSGNWMTVNSLGLAATKNSLGTLSTATGAWDGTLNDATGNGQPYVTSLDYASRGVGNNYSLFVNGQRMAAPTCSVSAGGTTAVGTYQFFFVPVWQNNGEGTYSNLSTACTTTTGNQTITINGLGNIPGNPLGQVLYECTSCGSAGRGLGGGVLPPSTTSFVWSDNASGWRIGVARSGTVGMPTGGPTMLMPGTQGIATPALTVAGTPFVSLTLPTISTHFNTSGDSIAATSTATFLITVGTGAGTSTGAITLPTAPNGWNCTLTNKNRAATIQQSGDTATTATFTNFGTTFAATNWTNSDVLYGSCFPR